MEVKITVTPTNESSKNQNPVCSLCSVQFAKYTCPRCNIQYCSLQCYKCEKHADCSENFYRDSFISELQLRTTSAAEKRKMMEMLKRLEEENSQEEGGQEEGGEEEVLSLEERLAGLDLDKDMEEVWKRLTESEQRQFQKAMSSGRLGSLLNMYTPWWNSLKPVVSVEEGTRAAQGTCSSPSPIPNILPGLPPVNISVKGGKVSPLIRYSILNVIYAYAYTVRMYNGEHHDLPVEASQTVMDISGCLSENASYSMAGEAITHAVTTVQQNHRLFSSAEWTFLVIKDVSHILCSQPANRCLAPYALSDLYNLLGSAKSQLKKERGHDSSTYNSQEQYKMLWMAWKKVYFFTSWASENLEALLLLADVVNIEHDTIVTRWKEQIHVHSAQQRPSPDKRTSTIKCAKLIEEL